MALNVFRNELRNEPRDAISYSGVAEIIFSEEHVNAQESQNSERNVGIGGPF